MTIDVDEILMAAAYYVGNSEILPERITQSFHLMGMVVAEVKVVIQYGALLLGIIQERLDLVL